MSFFSMNFDRPGPGVHLPPPKKGLPRFFFLLGNHWWKIIRLNWLMILFSLPVITAPAALTAANRICMKLAREGNCFLWLDFWEEFKRSFSKSLFIGMILGLFLFMGIMSSYYCEAVFSGTAASLMKAFCIAVAAYSALTGCYAFAMAAILNASSYVILKNALLMTVAALKTSLILIAVIAIFITQILLLPYSAPLLIFITSGLVQLIICVAVSEPIKRYITHEN